MHLSEVNTSLYWTVNVFLFPSGTITSLMWTFFRSVWIRTCPHVHRRRKNSKSRSGWFFLSSMHSTRHYLFPLHSTWIWTCRISLISIQKFPPSTNGTTGLSIDIDQMDEEGNQDEIQVTPPNLSEAMEMLERFRLLSTTTHPQLHQIVLQLESQLTDLYLERKVSKQSKIEDFFRKQS